ncbi:hypothetical protein MY3957_002655 [Beauveria namnaoensis]
MGDSSVATVNRALAQLNVNRDAKRLVVAIDFGTTYSGIAYCFPDLPPDGKLTAIRKWPGTHVQAAKVPTIVKYDKNDWGKYEWGTLLKSAEDHIVGIKLLLDPSQKLPWHVPPTDLDATMKLLPPFKTPKNVATDFMRSLKAHGMSQIATNLAQDALDLFQVEYVMSVPAVWSDAAKNATLEAAKAAGISPVTLIKEPEAAALYSIRQLDAFLTPGDVIVICDAGGGTVDLISYEIEKVSPSLELREIVPGTGDTVGSIALNRRFKAVLEALIPSDRWQKFKDSRAMVKASQQFENEIKLEFSGDLNEEFYVDLPGADLEDIPEKGLMGNEWKMTGRDVKAIFDPVIADILHLIQHQVQAVQREGKAVRAIFLVGGFGSSEYLRKEVERVHEGIKVAQPDDAWAAIAKGAALSKMPDNAVVTSVSAVRHYGVECGAMYDKVIDKGQPSYYGRFTGERMAHRMSWHITIGDNIKRNDKIRLGFYRHLPENFTANDAVFKSTLYDCVDENAPIHRSKSRNVKVNCVVYADVSKVPLSKFSKRTRKHSQALVSKQAGFPSETDDHGETYWEVTYDLVICFDSAVMKFSMELDGETLGSVEARFEQ